MGQTRQPPRRNPGSHGNPELDLVEPDPRDRHRPPGRPPGLCQGNQAMGSQNAHTFAGVFQIPTHEAGQPIHPLGVFAADSP